MVREFLDPILDKLTSAVDAEAVAGKDSDSATADLAELIHDSADIAHAPAQDISRKKTDVTTIDFAPHAPAESSYDVLAQLDDAAVAAHGAEASAQINDWLEYLRAGT